MVMINGHKYACEPCIRGHRSSKCKHNERVVILVRKPGRPLSQCPHQNPGMAGASNLPPKMIYPKQYNIPPQESTCDCHAVTVAIPKKQKCPCSENTTPSEEQLTFATTDQLVDNKVRIGKTSSKRRSPTLSNGKPRKGGCAVNFIGNDKASDELLQQVNSGNPPHMQGMQAGQGMFQTAPYPMAFPNGNTYGTHPMNVNMSQLPTGHGVPAPSDQFDMAYNGSCGGVWNALGNSLANGLNGGLLNTHFEAQTNGMSNGQHQVPLAAPALQPAPPNKAPCCSSRNNGVTPPQPSQQASNPIVRTNIGFQPDLNLYNTYNVGFYDASQQPLIDQYPYELLLQNGATLPQPQHPSPTPCDNAWATGCQCGPSCNCPMCPQHPYNERSRALVRQLQVMVDEEESFNNGDIVDENGIKQEGTNGNRDLSPVLPIPVLNPDSFVFVNYPTSNCDCPDECARADGECCRQRRSFEQLGAGTNGVDRLNDVQMGLEGGLTSGGKMEQPMQLNFPQQVRSQLANEPEQQPKQQQLQQQQQQRLMQERACTELEQQQQQQQQPLQMPQVTQSQLQATV